MADYNFEKTPIGFDVDKMDTDTHLLLEQYHIFSKTPAAPTTALGGARNKAGHTTTSSDIWSQEIPAFFKAYSNDDLTRFATLAKKNDLVLLAFTKSATEPNGAVLKFVDGAWTKIHDSIASIPDGTEFYNSVDTKPVIRFHQNSAAVILSGDNNNTDGSNGFSAKICSWNDDADAPFPASALKFVPQFVSPMDKMINGIPSSGYDAIVKVGTTEDDILAESPSSPAGYIANNYAGIIHFNTARSDGDIYVHAFEYIGDKLDSSLSAHQDKLDELDDKLGKISMTAAGGLQGISDTAKAAGLTEKWVKLVNGEEIEAEKGDEGAYPVVDITTAEFKDGIFVDNDDNKTKLVTAQDVTAFVNNHVKENSVKTISINDNSGQLAESFVADENNNISLGEGIDKVYNINRLFPNVRKTHYEQSTLHDVNYDTVENGEKVWDDTCALTYLRYYFYMQDVAKFGCGPDEIYAAQDTASPKTDKNGNPLTIKDTISYQKMQGGLTVKYFRKVYSKSIELQGSWATRFFRGTKTREISYYDDEGNFLYSTYVNPINWSWRPYHDTKTNEIKHNCILTGTDVVYDKETETYITVGIGQQAQPGWIDYGFDAFCNPNKGWDLIINGAELDEYNSEVSASGIKVVQAENLLDSVTVTPATYTPATTETLASWTDKDNVITGSNVESFVNATVGADLAKLEEKVNAYHEAGVSYKVHTDTTLPDLTIPANIETYKNVILLVPTSVRDTNDLDDTEAMSGGYIEYLCVKTGETTYAWEKIGTTEADLRGYVRAISSQNNTQDSYTSPVYASISSYGYLTLGVDSATSTKLGVSKMFTDKLSTDASTVVDTAVSVKSAQEMYKTLADSAAIRINSINGNSITTRSRAFNIIPAYGNLASYSDKQEAALVGEGIYTWDSGITVEVYHSHSLVGSIQNINEKGEISRYQQAGVVQSVTLPPNTVSVIGNVLTQASSNNISEVRTTLIAPEKFVSDIGVPSTITEWIADMPNFVTSDTTGEKEATFYDCDALTTFIGDLSSLKYAHGMFSGCSSLETFIGDLSSLEYGTVSLTSGSTGMFTGTNLSVESVENIADTLPTIVADTTKNLYGVIQITWNSLTSDAAKQQELVGALSGIVDKGWALVTNSALHSKFDTNEYKIESGTVQAPDLDSEPQEYSYIIKK